MSSSDATAVRGTATPPTTRLRLDHALPAGATFTRASTKSRVIATGGASFEHAVDEPVFEWLPEQARHALSIDSAGADPTADDVCAIPLQIGSSTEGGRLELVACPQFDASARVGQAENDWLLSLPLGEVAIVWAGSMAGVAGASEAGWRIELGPAFAHTLRKLVVTRHAAGQRISFVLHWGGGYKPHIQIDGWARILNGEIGTFARQSSALLHQYFFPFPTPAWHLDLNSRLGRYTPARLFGVAGDSISSETDEIWPTVLSSNWPRTFGARLLARENGYVLAEGVPGREMPDWLTDSRLLDSNCTDIIFAIGTNDIDHHAGDNLATMQANAAALRDQALAAGKRVYFWTVPPGSYAAAKEALRGTWNAWLVGGGLGASVTILNTAASIVDPGDSTSILAAWREIATPNHPNSTGSVVLGNAVADALGLP